MTCHVHWKVRSDTHHFRVEPGHHSPCFLCPSASLIHHDWESPFHWPKCRWRCVKRSFQTTQNGQEHEKDNETHLCYYKSRSFLLLSFWIPVLAPTARVLNFLSFNFLTNNEIILPTYMPIKRAFKMLRTVSGYRKNSVPTLTSYFHWMKFILCKKKMFRND